jgi:hypothetical protein
LYCRLGVIQAIHPDEHPDYNRICKEIVVFQAKHLEMLEALLHIDVTAAPKQQVRLPSGDQDPSFGPK